MNCVSVVRPSVHGTDTETDTVTAPAICAVAFPELPAQDVILRGPG